MRALRLVLIASIGIAALGARQASAVQKIQIVPNPINGGAPMLNQPGQPVSVTITNVGDGFLKVSTIAIAGGDAGDFALAGVPQLPISMGAGIGFTFTVTFTPTMCMPRSSTMTVTSDDPNSPSVLVTLKGSCGPPMITLDIGSLIIGNVRVGLQSSPQLFTITNSGNGDLIVTSLVPGGANPGDYSLNPMNAVGTIGPQLSQKFSVIFKPQALGTRTATVTINNNDTNKTVSVQGTGTMDNLSAAPLTLDFKTQKEYLASSPSFVTVTNTGNDFANITGASFSGPQSGSFAISGNAFPLKVPANGGSVKLNIVAVPLQLGPNNATLTIMYDDPMKPMATVALTVVGVGGMIGVAPNYIDFGGQAVNSTSPKQMVTITNNGTDVLNITNFMLNDPMMGFGNVTPIMPMTMIAPKATKTFDVEFTPTAAMAYVASVDISTDDPLAKLLRIPLAGTGTMTGISVSPMTVEFNSIAVNSTVGPRQVTITNIGGTQVMVSSVTLTGMAPQAFAIDQTGPFTIDPAKSQMVNLTFTPLSAGSQSASLSISIAGMPPINVSLHGVGSTAMLGYAPQSLDFGMVTVGTASDPQTVGLKNGGSSMISLAGIASSDPAYVIDTSATNMNLSANGTTTFQVRFVPPAVGTRAGTIAVSVKGMTMTFNVAATGMGAPPVMRKAAGGCSATGGGATTWPFGLLLLAFALALAATTPRLRRALRRR